MFLALSECVSFASGSRVGGMMREPSKKKPLNRIFNVGPHGVIGSKNQINNMLYARAGQDFSVKVGPSTRRLIDMSQPLQSSGILPAGISGNPLSKHFDDQNASFLKGDYRPMILDWNAIRSLPSLTLTPRE